MSFQRSKYSQNIQSKKKGGEKKNPAEIDSAPIQSKVLVHKF